MTKIKQSIGFYYLGFILILLTLPSDCLKKGHYENPKFYSSETEEEVSKEVLKNPIKAALDLYLSIDSILSGTVLKNSTFLFPEIIRLMDIRDRLKLEGLPHTRRKRSIQDQKDKIKEKSKDLPFSKIIELYNVIVDVMKQYKSITEDEKVEIEKGFSECANKPDAECLETLITLLRRSKNVPTSKMTLTGMNRGLVKGKQQIIGRHPLSIPISQGGPRTVLNCGGLGTDGEGPNFCFPVLSGDQNSVFRNFKTYKNGEEGLYLFTETNPDPECQDSIPVWSNVMYTTGFDHSFDFFKYELHRASDIFSDTLQDSIKDETCPLRVCDICIVTRPKVLDGDCRIEWFFDGSHKVRLCNKEAEPLGYILKPLQSQPRLISSPGTNSNSIVYGLYVAAKGILGYSNVIQTKPGTDVRIDKGVLNPRSCSELSYSKASSDWVYTYVKCGRNVDYHHETFPLEKRCSLKFSQKTMGSFQEWTCLNWYWSRYLVIFFTLIFIMMFLYFIGVHVYIIGFAGYITAPFSYLIFKIWPCKMRCKCCLYPWHPWHTCPSVCVCGISTSNKYHYCPLSSLKDCREQEEKIRRIFDDIEEGKAPAEEEDKLKKIISNVESLKSSSKFTYQTFASYSNPYTRYTTVTVIYLAFYLLLVFTIPATLALEERCVKDCIPKKIGWETRDQSYCQCYFRADCGDHNRTGMYIYEKISTGVINSKLVIPNQCRGMKEDEDALRNLWLTAIFIEANNTCLEGKVGLSIKDLVKHIEAQDLLRMLPSTDKSCDPYPSFVKEVYQRLLNTAKEESAFGILSAQFHGANKTDEVRDHLKTISENFKDKMDVLLQKRTVDLSNELNSILNTFLQNGSIYGKDHSVPHLDPPSSINYVYTTLKDESTVSIDMSFQIDQGFSSSYRPIHAGSKPDIYFTISIPEVAATYALTYEYTSCQIKENDVVRYDKCVGNCDACFDALDSSLKDDQKLFLKQDFRGQISFDNPNTWGCEGKGCWTVKTGCLCAYCRPIPNPGHCMDVYSRQYIDTRYQLCLTVSGVTKCQHAKLGESVERLGKLQLVSSANTEWAKFGLSSIVAIDHSDNSIYEGDINRLGETSTKFGSVQFSRNMSLLSMMSSVDASYTCHHQEDQTVNIKTCAKDTWNLRTTLQKSYAFIVSQDESLIFHVGSSAGTARLILHLPTVLLEPFTESLNIKIKKALCQGCYKCQAGSTCTLSIESSATGLVRVTVDNGYLSAQSLYVKRGTQDYIMKGYFDDSEARVFSLVAKDNTVYSENSARFTLVEGNSARTTVRNTTQVNLKTRIATFTDNPGFFNYINPVGWLGVFGSNLIIRVFKCISYVIFSIIIILLIYYTIRYFTSYMTGKWTKNRYNHSMSAKESP